MTYTIEDAYACAISSSPSFRMDHERRTPIDIVLSVAISKPRLGSAIMRLHTEWDRQRRAFGKVPNAEISQSLNTWSMVEASLIRRCDAAGIDHGIARLAMFHFLNPHCECCNGTGVILKGEVEKPCKACNATGKRREPDDANVLAIVDYMKSCTSAAAQSAHKFLHGG